MKMEVKSPDENVEQHFLNSLETDIKDIYNKFKFKMNVRMTERDKIDFENDTHCHICDIRIR